MSGGFNFQVNDGVNFTPRQIFSITARALVLSLEKNHPLKVFPGKSHQRISSSLYNIASIILYFYCRLPYTVALYNTNCSVVKSRTTSNGFPCHMPNSPTMFHGLSSSFWVILQTVRQTSCTPDASDNKTSWVEVRIEKLNKVISTNTWVVNAIPFLKALTLK